MIIEAFTLIIGLVLILAGASFLTDGSVIIARRFNIPQIGRASCRERVLRLV